MSDRCAVYEYKPVPFDLADATRNYLHLIATSLSHASQLERAELGSLTLQCLEEHPELPLDKLQKLQASCETGFAERPPNYLLVNACLAVCQLNQPEPAAVELALVPDLMPDYAHATRTADRLEEPAA